MNRTYASNLAGVTMLAYDNWTFHKRQVDEHRGDEVDEAIAAGKCSAYDVIVHQATGRHAGWFCDRDVLAQFLGCTAGHSGADYGIGRSGVI
jgi:hypothetical protein